MQRAGNIGARAVDGYDRADFEFLRGRKIARVHHTLVGLRRPRAVDQLRAVDKCAVVCAERGVGRLCHIQRIGAHGQLGTVEFADLFAVDAQHAVHESFAADMLHTLNAGDDLDVVVGQTGGGDDLQIHGVGVDIILRGRVAHIRRGGVDAGKEADAERHDGSQ